jgi:hypothetical protein
MVLISNSKVIGEALIKPMEITICIEDKKKPSYEGFFFN